MEDLDVFVTGVKGNFLEVSVLLKDHMGLEEEVVVGNVEIPKRLRELKFPQFSQNFFHRPMPNSNVIGRVLVVKATGYDMVHKCFNNLQADWSTGFRSDKSPLDCVLDPSSIESRWLKKVM